MCQLATFCFLTEAKVNMIDKSVLFRAIKCNFPHKVIFKRVWNLEFSSNSGRWTLNSLFVARPDPFEIKLNVSGAVPFVDRWNEGDVKR